MLTYYHMSLSLDDRVAAAVDDRGRIAGRAEERSLLLLRRTSGLMSVD
jgi:hypothetical protein